MVQKMVIMMGIQGSGKSTFYHRYLEEEYIRVNLDTLKTRHQEKLLIQKCIEDGKNFAIDNTNPTKEDRQRYRATPHKCHNPHYTIGAKGAK